MRTLEARPGSPGSSSPFLGAPRGAGPARPGAADAAGTPRGFGERERRPAFAPGAGGLTMIDPDDLIGCLERHGCRALRVYGETGKGDAVRWS
jgi:hypothetical protein